MATVTTADCLPDPLVRAIASGEVPEPLLGVYLAHLESCDACCSRLEQANPGHRRSVGVRPSASVSSVREDPADAWLGSWLDSLKGRLAVGPGDRPFPIGARIGGFRVTASLGAGASALVYEAIDEDLGRPVVLKVLRSAHHGLVDPRQLPDQHRLMVAEARAFAQLQHDAIMPLLQLFWHDDSPVLVFPRLPGETLADALAVGRCTPRMALSVVRDVASGLAHAHAQGIFHHDVKPSNIWLWRRAAGDRETTLLFDFGLSGGTTIRAGTPGYADPGSNGAGDPESDDLFSLGVVLHECLAGPGNNPPGCARGRRTSGVQGRPAAWTASLRSVGRFVESLPGRRAAFTAGGHALARLLTRAEPAERLRAAGVVVEIDRLLASPRRHAWTAAAGLAAFVILASVGIGAVRPGAARSIRDVTLSSTMILPDMVVPTGGVPATLSADGLRIAAVTDGPGLRLRALDDADGGDTVPLDFRPDRLAFSPAGDRLAAADEGGHLLILDVPTGGTTLRHRFDRGVGWLGWAGWNREALLVQSGGEVHSFCKTRKAASDASIPDWWLEFLRGDVQRLATLPGTEGIISTGGDGRITMWSAGRFTDDTALPLGDTVWISRRDLFGWKGRGSCYVVTGRQILEFAPYHGIRAAEIVAPAESIAWIGESRYAFVTDAASGPPRLLLGDLARPGWSRACELGSETPLQLHVLDDQRVAVATREGTIRIYQPRF